MYKIRIYTHPINKKRIIALHTHHMSLNSIVFADSESESESDSSDSSDPDVDDEGEFDAEDLVNSPIQPEHEDLDLDASQPDRLALFKHADDNHSEDEPDCSDDEPEWDGGPDGRFNALATHLTKLDSLTARGCADKFFKVHTARWAPSMPRPGNFLHSARAGGLDVRESRKRKASEITRSAAETHAFCTATNLSQITIDHHLQTFTNVSIVALCDFAVCAETDGDSVTPAQGGFDPNDVPFRSIRTLHKTVRGSMLPGSEVMTKHLHEALDGDQPMEFHYVSILAEIKRMLGNPAYPKTMYTQFEYETMRY